MGKIVGRKMWSSTRNQLNKIAVELFEEIKLFVKIKLFVDIRLPEEIKLFVYIKLSEEIKLFVEMIDWYWHPTVCFPPNQYEV